MLQVNKLKNYCIKYVDIILGYTFDPVPFSTILTEIQIKSLKELKCIEVRKVKLYSEVHLNHVLSIFEDLNKMYRWIFTFVIIVLKWIPWLCKEKQAGVIYPQAPEGCQYYVLLGSQVQIFQYHKSFHICNFCKSPMAFALFIPIACNDIGNGNRFMVMK